MKRRIGWIITAVILAIIGGVIALDNARQAAYLRNVKQELQALAADPLATRQHVAKLNSDRWTDGRVGITADGYIFYYDMHESHGMDNINDVHTFYLPDERRFIINRKHYCVDLSKDYQPKSKADLLPMFYAGN
jgi:hypothetical protein